MATPDAIHPEFGSVVCRKCGAAKYWVLVVVLLLVASGLAILAVYLATPKTLPLSRSDKVAGRPRTVERADGPAAVFFVLAAAVGGIAVWPLRTAMTRTAFYEHGATSRVWGKERAIAYTDATSLRYQLIQGSSHYGVSGGMAVVLSFESGDGQRIVYSGDLRRKPLEPFSLFSGKYRTTDTIESAMVTIASFVADRWQSTIVDGGSCVWCGVASIASDGLTLRTGRDAGRLIPWSAIQGWSFQDGRLELSQDGADATRIRIKPGSDDFYTGIEVLKRMLAVHHPEPSPDA